jgi:ribonuclease Z
MRVSRIVVALFGLLFALLGAGFWAAPDLAAARFHIEAVGVLGLSTLRADFGALFFGLAGLCLAAAWSRQRILAVAAALILGVAILARLIGIAVNGWDPAIAPNLAVEALAALALAIYARGLGKPAGRAGWIAAGVAVLVLALAAGAAFSPTIQQRLFERAAARQIASSNAGLLKDDALRIAVCGSSAPLPSTRRAKACVAVMVGGKFYLVDVGPESVENLMLWGVPLERIGGVLITHFHSDHIGDLGEVNLQTWAQGRPAPLKVYGGPGVEQVVAGFNQAYRLDQGYRTAHHTERMMPAATWPMVAQTVELVGPPTPAKSRQGLVLDDGALKITAIEVDHSPVEPAYAYRFDYKGRSVVITGDLKAHPPLIAGARGADVLVSEAIARPMVRTLEATGEAAGRPRVQAIMHDVQSYHISPEEAADAANKAGVKLLVFYHLLPAPDNFLTRRVFTRGVNGVRQGDWTMAEDGSLYTLPIGSHDIRIGRITR